MSRPATLALGIIVALLIGVFIWWRLDRSTPPSEVPPAQDTAPLVEPIETAEDVAPSLPALDGSDEYVRQMLGSLGLIAPLLDGVAGDELVRNFVVAVNRIADGRSPRRQLGFLEPDGHFAAVSRGEKLFIDPQSYRRYDPVAVAFAAVDPTAAARMLRRLRPLMDAAQAELGTGESFESVLQRALQVLLETPLPTGDVELIEAVQSYHFADPTLQALSSAQQHLLRMGPANGGAIQERLRRIRDTLTTMPVGG